MNIVCVGDCGIDHYLPDGRQLVGGITANFARHAQRSFPAEDTINIVSCVGTDKAGELVLSTISGQSVRCEIIKIAGSTSTQTIDILVNGEKCFVHYDAGVLADFVPTASQVATISTANLLVVPVYVQILDLYERILAIENDAVVVVDFADFAEHPDIQLLERHIDTIDIGFFGLSTEDQPILQRLQQIAEDHDKTFIVTLGADGSRVFSRGQCYARDATRVESVVDTTGAGDAYAAGFLSLYCHGADIPASMQRGADIAAQVVQNIGSWIEETS